MMTVRRRHNGRASGLGALVSNMQPSTMYAGAPRHSRALHTDMAVPFAGGVGRVPEGGQEADMRWAAFVG
jgi:hypothetical protein